MNQQNLIRPVNALLSRKNHIRIKFSFSPTILNLSVIVYLVVAFNHSLFEKIDDLHTSPGWDHALFMVSVVVLLSIIISFFLSFFTYKYIHKITLIVIIISSSITSFYMDTFGILIDKSMLQNVLETDVAEAHEILSFSLFSSVLIFGLIPALAIIFVSVSYPSFLKGSLINLRDILAALLLLGVIASIYYQDYASLFRNNAFIRDMAVPVNFVNATKGIVKDTLFESNQELVTIGKDAKLGSILSNNKKRVISVLVMGETARAENFSLNGYERNTNPNLSHLITLNFTNFSSCGTTTAISVPCLFSKATRKQFNSAKADYTENLLDIVQRAGMPVYWIDNNSGCKEVCRRVNFIDVSKSDDLEFCTQKTSGFLKKECYDEILVKALKKTIASTDEDMFIILHQKGSHGPAYYLRTPNEFQQFQPLCKTSEMQFCRQQEIVNAYDNTILYSDFVISEVIEELHDSSEDYDSSLMYVSDHGESLGEKGLFLHGLPYMFAPSQQTDVPFMAWIPQSFAERFGIDIACLQSLSSEAFSHDNLFSTFLSWLNIETSEYTKDLDIFSSCRA